MVEHVACVERLEVDLEGHHVMYYEKGKLYTAAAREKEDGTKLV